MAAAAVCHINTSCVHAKQPPLAGGPYTHSTATNTCICVEAVQQRAMFSHRRPCCLLPEFGCAKEQMRSGSAAC